MAAFLPITCPYCGHHFQIDIDAPQEKKTVPANGKIIIFKVKCEQCGSVWWEEPDRGRYPGEPA
jgi:predicted Zn finger-like uncharacterized protein